MSFLSAFLLWLMTLTGAMEPRDDDKIGSCLNQKTCTASGYYSTVDRQQGSTEISNGF